MLDINKFRTIAVSLVFYIAILSALAPCSSQAGEPTTLAELNTWYPDVPADQNAATIYAEAFSALVMGPYGSDLSIPQNQKALALLHQAATRTHSRYPIDLNNGYNTLLPHLAKVKLSAELLQQEAILNATKGRMDLALQSIQAGLCLARSLNQEPSLISQLVRARAIEIAATSLEQSLWHHTFTDEQLIQMQTAFQEQEAGNADAFSRSLKGERCLGLSAFQLSPDKLATLTSQFAGNPELAVAPSASSTITNHMRSKAFKDDLEFYSQQSKDIILIMESPFPGNLDAAMTWEIHIGQANTKDYILSSILLPTLAKTPEKAGIALAELRVAQTILATERYRLAHKNTLPDSLNDLVPQFLKAVPADPFDGASLRFKKIPGRGYMIYSIGKDRQDDGGIHKPLKPLVGSHYDLAITVLQ